MADLPITFSPAMVRALLAGTKTQTRRLLIPQPPADFRMAEITDGSLRFAPASLLGSPFHKQLNRLRRPGDRLYVREQWRTIKEADPYPPCTFVENRSVIRFEADGAGYANPVLGKFRQAMHMPKWASRLTLPITETRVQRLHEISQKDCLAEGPPEIWSEPSMVDGGVMVLADVNKPWIRSTPRAWYHGLWDELNADRAPWSTNPWVVAYTFEVKHGNIADLKGATT